MVSYSVGVKFEKIANVKRCVIWGLLCGLGTVDLQHVIEEVQELLEKYYE